MLIYVYKINNLITKNDYTCTHFIFYLFLILMTTMTQIQLVYTTKYILKNVHI
jgi:hypothetical protein